MPANSEHFKFVVLHGDPLFGNDMSHLTDDRGCGGVYLCTKFDVSSFTRSKIREGSQNLKFDPRPGHHTPSGKYQDLSVENLENLEYLDFEVCLYAIIYRITQRKMNVVY